MSSMLAPEQPLFIKIYIIYFNYLLNIYAVSLENCLSGGGQPSELEAT
jgi:hypothetical protein